MAAERTSQIQARPRAHTDTGTHNVPLLKHGLDCRQVKQGQQAQHLGNIFSSSSLSFSRN